MEAASLKIKFTSLIKKLHENESKCCLEIVPEVTCLQNFDKMLQKQENSLYEYAIPITYKIILKKCNKDIKHNPGYELNQTYHSCVDILHAPAINYIDETGDIKPFLSETVLLNKQPTNFHGWNMDIPKPEKTQNRYSNPEDKLTESTQTNETGSKFTLTCSENRNLNKIYTGNSTDDIEKQYCAMRNIDVQVDSTDNILDTINDTIVDNGSQKLSNKNNNLSINDSYKDCNVNETRKLSRTPICSINTNDMFMTNPNENIVIHNSIAMKNNMGRVKDVVLYNYMSPITKPMMDIAYVPLNDFKTLEPYKNTPEARIAEFIQLIEYEMLPLKYMLNDIVSKYTALNVDDQVKKTLLSTKPNSQVENFRCRNQLRSNRVFYTIVCDD